MKLTLVNAYNEKDEDIQPKDIEIEYLELDHISTKYYSNELLVKMVDGTIYRCDEVN